MPRKTKHVHVHVQQHNKNLKWHDTTDCRVQIPRNVTHILKKENISTQLKRMMISLHKYSQGSIQCISHQISSLLRDMGKLIAKYEAKNEMVGDSLIRAGLVEMITKFLYSTRNEAMTSDCLVIFANITFTHQTRNKHFITSVHVKLFKYIINHWDNICMIKKSLAMQDVSISKTEEYVAIDAIFAVANIFSVWFQHNVSILSKSTPGCTTTNNAISVQQFIQLGLWLLKNCLEIISTYVQNVNISKLNQIEVTKHITLYMRLLSCTTIILFGILNNDGVWIHGFNIAAIGQQLSTFVRRFMNILVAMDTIMINQTAIKWGDNYQDVKYQIYGIEYNRTSARLMDTLARLQTMQLSQSPSVGSIAMSCDFVHVLNTIFSKHFDHMNDAYQISMATKILTLFDVISSHDNATVENKNKSKFDSYFIETLNGKLLRFAVQHGSKISKSNKDVNRNAMLSMRCIFHLLSIKQHGMNYSKHTSSIAIKQNVCKFLNEFRLLDPILKWFDWNDIDSDKHQKYPNIVTDLKALSLACIAVLSYFDARLLVKHACIYHKHGSNQLCIKRGTSKLKDVVIIDQSIKQRALDQLLLFAKAAPTSLRLLTYTQLIYTTIIERHNLQMFDVFRFIYNRCTSGCKQPDYKHHCEIDMRHIHLNLKIFSTLILFQRDYAMVYLKSSCDVFCYMLKCTRNCFDTNMKDRFTRITAPLLTSKSQILTTSIDTIDQYCADGIQSQLNESTLTKKSWQYISRLWFNGYTIHQYFQRLYDLLLYNYKLSLQIMHQECVVIADDSDIQQMIKNKFWKRLIVRVQKSLSEIVVLKWNSIMYNPYKFNNSYDPYKFNILLVIEGLLMNHNSSCFNAEANVQLTTILGKVLRKCCFRDAAVSSSLKVHSTVNTTCCVWRLAGIYHLYHEFSIKLAIYCFKKALSCTKLDRVENLKHLILIYSIMDRQHCAQNCMDKLNRIGKQSYGDFTEAIKKVTMQMNNVDGNESMMNASISRRDIVQTFGQQFIVNYDYGYNKFWGLGLKRSAHSKIAKHFKKEKHVQTIYNIFMQKKCNWVSCNKKETKLNRCKRCKSVYYCSKLCQKKDWSMSELGSVPHKMACK